MNNVCNKNAVGTYVTENNPGKIIETFIFRRNTRTHRLSVQPLGIQDLDVCGQQIGSNDFWE